jgi:transposase
VLLERWPLAQDLAASPRTVRLLAKRVLQNHYGPEKLGPLLRAAAESVALTQGADARRMEIRALLARWALVREQMAAAEDAPAASVEGCAPARALTKLPEVSAVCAATIVAELGTPEDYEHPRQVLKLAGMNLVEKSSGLSRGRARQSKRGRPELRRQLFLLAARWVKQGRGLYRPNYDALLARNGGLKTKARCAVARKLVPLVLAVAQSGEPFDRERWLRARHQRGVEAGDLTA